MQSNQPDLRADDKNKKPVSDKSPALMLMRVLQGALIGGGAILPGVSGGVLAVVFGIYRPMMELLSHPFRALKKNLWLFIPIVIGVGIGFVGFAKLMALLFAEDSPYPISLFVGLILGTVPSLLKTARSQGRKPAADMTALILTFAGLLAFLIILEGTGSMNLTLTPVWALISGLIWGFSLIVPGLSSSSILIFMGLYKSIMDDVGRLQLGTVIPPANVHNSSILDFTPARHWDLTLIKRVLIHINPEVLLQVYDKLFAACGRYLMVAEYYNPAPVAIPYRGRSDRLFKRDFAGEIMDRHPQLQLVDYGFDYRRDPNFPQDDITWFLMEKQE